jgi:hypothetical protein
MTPPTNSSPTSKTSSRVATGSCTAWRLRGWWRRFTKTDGMTDCGLSKITKKVNQRRRSHDTRNPEIDLFVVLDIRGIVAVLRDNPEDDLFKLEPVSASPQYPVARLAAESSGC